MFPIHVDKKKFIGKNITFTFWRSRGGINLSPNGKYILVTYLDSIVKLHSVGAKSKVIKAYKGAKIEKVRQRCQFLTHNINIPYWPHNVVLHFCWDDYSWRQACCFWQWGSQHLRVGHPLRPTCPSLARSWWPCLGSRNAPDKENYCFWWSWQGPFYQALGVGRVVYGLIWIFFVQYYGIVFLTTGVWGYRTKEMHRKLKTKQKKTIIYSSSLSFSSDSESNPALSAERSSS